MAEQNFPVLFGICNGSRYGTTSSIFMELEREMTPVEQDDLNHYVYENADDWTSAAELEQIVLEALSEIGIGAKIVQHNHMSLIWRS